MGQQNYDDEEWMSSSVWKVRGQHLPWPVDVDNEQLLTGNLPTSLGSEAPDHRILLSPVECENE